MKLTPLDIKHKEFDFKLKGYDKEQVNHFLDQLILDFEELIKENKELNKKLRFAEEKLEHFSSLQDALNKSIVVAQDAADRLKENARKEAEIILFEAEKSADRLLKEAAGKATRINTETDDVRKQSRIFKQKLEYLVESQMNLIRNEEWDSLLNRIYEETVETPTLNEVLSNRAGKVDKLVNQSLESALPEEKGNEAAPVLNEVPSAADYLEEAAVEAIEILVENK